MSLPISHKPAVCSHMPVPPQFEGGMSPHELTHKALLSLEHKFSTMKHDDEIKVKAKSHVSLRKYQPQEEEPEQKAQHYKHEPKHEPKTHQHKTDEPSSTVSPTSSTKTSKLASTPSFTDVPTGTKPSRNTPIPPYSGIVDVDKPIIVKAGQTFDGHGMYYRPTKAMGDGSQNEHQQPVFILEPGATLKNVQYSGGDGIHLIGSGTLDNVVNRDIGEDAVTIDGEKNRLHDAKLSGMDVNDIPKGPAKVLIVNSKFYNGDDKVVQDNGDAEVLMKNVYVNGAGKLFRTNGGQPITTKLTVEDSTFENVKESLFRTDSKTSSAHFSNVDDGGMKVVALTPDASQITGTGKISYKPYTG